MEKCKILSQGAIINRPIQFFIPKAHKPISPVGAIINRPLYTTNTHSQTGSVVTVGVGLHSDYGSAQRMYVKRGYLPDGSGRWYKDSPHEPYTPCVSDDDLVLYLSKNFETVRPAL